MTNNVSIFILGIALIVIVIRLIPGKQNFLGIPGKLIWKDEGKRTRAFVNTRFGVFGKPDFIFKQKSGFLGIEYKSRESNIYESDIVQVKTASLAARANGYKITRVLIKTNRSEKYINLPKSDQELFNQIKPYVVMARQAKKAMPMKANPSYMKCKFCAFKSDCKFRYRSNQ